MLRPLLAMIPLPDGVPIGKLRSRFETEIRGSDELHAQVTLDAIEDEGVFWEYRDAQTQAMWVGFVMGRISAH